MQVGPIFDAKRSGLPILVGSISIVTSVMLQEMCRKSYQFFVIFSILNGLGTSFVLTPSIASIDQEALPKQGTAADNAGVVNAIEGVIFSIMFPKFFPRIGFDLSARRSFPLHSR